MLKKKQHNSGTLEVAEVAREGMVNLFCRGWDEGGGKKMKSLRKFSQFSCYQQGFRTGNTVSTRAAKLALISRSRCNHEWIELGPGRSPRHCSGRACTSSGLRSIPRDIGSQPWQSRRWSTAPCCDLSKITRQTSAKIKHHLLMPLKKKKTVFLPE